MLERAELQQLVSQGLSDQEVADKVGVSSRTVLRWRKRYGIPSRWVPPIPEHGTVGRYGRGCSCPICLAAHASRHSDYVRRRNLASIPAAIRAWEPWTAAEDAIVLAHTPAEAVKRLHRSWSACVQRRALLRSQEVATV